MVANVYLLPLFLVKISTYKVFLFEILMMLFDTNYTVYKAAITEKHIRKFKVRIRIFPWFHPTYNISIILFWFSDKIWIEKSNITSLTDLFEFPNLILIIQTRFQIFVSWWMQLNAKNFTLWIHMPMESQTSWDWVRQLAWRQVTKLKKYFFAASISDLK